MYNAEYARQLRESYKALGRCANCGGTDVMPGRVTCVHCIEARIQLDQRMTQEQRARRNDAQRRRYQAHKEAGICIECQAPATHGLYCYEHMLRKRRQCRESYLRRKANSAPPAAAPPRAKPTPPKPSANHPWIRDNKIIFGGSKP